MKSHSLLTFIFPPQYGQFTRSISDSSIKSDTRTSNAFAISSNVFNVGLPFMAYDITGSETPSFKAISFCVIDFALSISFIRFISNILMQIYMKLSYILNAVNKNNTNINYLTFFNIKYLHDINIYINFTALNKYYY